MPYPLLTARLILEPLIAADTAAFVAYRQDPDAARWQSWESSYCAVDAERLIANQPLSDLPDRGGWIQLAIRDAATGSLYGDVGIHVVDDQPATFEIGVTLAAAAQGRGFGAEAVERVLSYLFDDAGAHRVVASCDARNAPAARLLLRVGMRHESHQLEADFFKGEWSTLDGFAVLGRER